MKLEKILIVISFLGIMLSIFSFYTSINYYLNNVFLCGNSLLIIGWLFWQRNDFVFNDLDFIGISIVVYILINAWVRVPTNFKDTLLPLLSYFHFYLFAKTLYLRNSGFSYSIFIHLFAAFCVLLIFLMVIYYENLSGFIVNRYNNSGTFAILLSICFSVVLTKLPLKPTQSNIFFCTSLVVLIGLGLSLTVILLGSRTAILIIIINIFYFILFFEVPIKRSC